MVTKKKGDWTRFSSMPTETEIKRYSRKSTCKNFRQVPGQPIGVLEGTARHCNRDRMIYYMNCGTKRVCPTLRHVARYVKRYPGCGIDLKKFSNLRQFRKRTLELENEAAGSVVFGNLEEHEETALAPDLDSLLRESDWGFDVWKYLPQSINHYVNLAEPAANESNVAQQVQANATSAMKSKAQQTITTNKVIFDNWLRSLDSFPRYFYERMAEIGVKPESDGKRETTISEDGVPVGFVKCNGNQIFKCNKGCHEEEWCTHGSTYYKALKESVTNHELNKERDKPSQKELIHKLDWQALPGQGILEAIQARAYPHLTEYVENDGPICSQCELRVSKLIKLNPATCKQCEKRTTTTYMEVTEKNLEHYKLQNHAPKRDVKTLVFLCARKSSVTAKLPKDYFKKLYEAVERSETKVGHFGDTNRPGYPKKLLLVGKFASAGSARSPLSALTVPTKEQAEDVMTLNMLSTFIINAYRPGDTILIAMNQPICFCIGQQDLKAFISDLFARGVPRDSLFIYCRGLQTEHGKTVNYATNILGADLLNGIINRVPRYGIRPAVSGYLYATEVGVFQRVNLPPKGRDEMTDDADNTPSQSALMDVRTEANMTLQCKHPLCREVEIVSKFLVQCGLCTKWFHGDCIGLSRSSAKKLNEKDMEWVCFDCGSVGKIGRKYLEENRLDLAVHHCKRMKDYSIFPEICIKGRELRAWATLADFLGHFAGKNTELDKCALYALARVCNLTEFQRVLLLTELQRSEIEDMAFTIEYEKLFIPEWSTFVDLLTDKATLICITPTLLSSHSANAMSRSDADEQNDNLEEPNDEQAEEQAEKQHEEPDDEQDDDQDDDQDDETDEMQDDETDEDQKENQDVEQVMEEQVSHMRAMSMSDSDRYGGASDARESLLRARKAGLKDNSELPLDLQPAKRPRFLSSPSSSLESPPTPSLGHLSTPIDFKKRRGLGWRKW